MVLGMSRPWKHPKTGVYWFRKAVPEAMRGLVGKVELRRTLRTKNPREAALRFTEVAANVAAEWEALRRGPEPLTPKQAVALAGLWYRWFTGEREEAAGDDPDGWVMLSEQLHDIDLSGRTQPDERDIPSEANRSPQTQQRIDAFLTKHGGINAFFEAKCVQLFPSSSPPSWTLWRLSFTRPCASSRAVLGGTTGQTRGPNGFLSGSLTYSLTRP